jgi:hypothetical protein
VFQKALESIWISAAISSFDLFFARFIVSVPRLFGQFMCTESDNQSSDVICSNSAYQTALAEIRGLAREHKPLSQGEHCTLQLLGIIVPSFFSTL